MTTATLKATPVPAGDVATSIRIRRAVGQPGAKGKKGFLLWTQAAFPKAISDRIIAAAGQHLDGQMVNAVRNRVSGSHYAGRTGEPGTMQVGLGRGAFGNFRGLGDDNPLVTVGVDVPDVSSSTNAAITNATDSSAADPSWLSSISSAISAAGQAYLTKTQIDASQQIFNTNLQRAQMGLPPIPTNPTAYGLPAPTVNFGLAGSAQSVVLWVGGGLALIVLISMMGKSRSKK